MILKLKISKKTRAQIVRKFLERELRREATERDRYEPHAWSHIQLNNWERYNERADHIQELIDKCEMRIQEESSKT